jgi:hypothetical protein
MCNSLLDMQCIFVKLIALLIVYVAKICALNVNYRINFILVLENDVSDRNISMEEQPILSLTSQKNNRTNTPV